MMKKNLVILVVIGLLYQATGASSEKPMPNQSTLLMPPRPVVSSIYAGVDKPQQAVFDPTNRRPARKGPSLKKAMMLSMLFPGAGEYYAGSKFKGQVFMGIEAALWAGFIGYRVYGGWKKEDFKSYAAAHAGVDNNGKSDEFYDWIGFYDNRDEFNQFGRLFFPDREYLSDSPANDWQWHSESDRERYKNIKDASKIAFRNSSFLLGMAIVNRVISGIDTYRTVKAARKKVSSISQVGEYRIKIKPKPFGRNPSIQLTVSRKF
jgi:hypothetical protein